MEARGACIAGDRTPPPVVALGLARLALAPWAWITAPRFHGLENIPTTRPVLFVGNHTLMGVLDVPLMRAGESILVFPGGGREVFKHKGEKYRLLWGDRTGFARLAIEHGYPILPFAAVGTEECFDIVLDAGDVLRILPPLRLLPRADEMPPLVRGIGLSMLPRPERFYFHFGPPIETEHLQGLQADERVCVALREQVRATVEAGIAFLQCQRARDPQRGFLTRVARDLRAAIPLGARVA